MMHLGCPMPRWSVGKGLLVPQLSPELDQEQYTRAVDFINVCLQRDAAVRPTAGQLLVHAFLTETMLQASSRSSHQQVSGLNCGANSSFGFGSSFLPSPTGSPRFSPRLGGRSVSAMSGQLASPVPAMNQSPAGQLVQSLHSQSAR
eukprot:gene1182-biopygen2498